MMKSQRKKVKVRVNVLNNNFYTNICGYITKNVESKNEINNVEYKVQIEYKVQKENEMQN